MRRFLSGVAREAELVSWNRPVDTVFWGGGTPGMLAPRALSDLGEIVRRHAGGSPGEWSVELAPASVTEQRLKALKDAGVTRISMGVQSFQPVFLDALGRRHTREQALRAYDLVRKAGFSSVNFDLIFAVPGQSLAEWREDLDEAVKLGPDHISTYCLTFEEDTVLFLKLAQGRVRLDVDKEAAFYTEAWERLDAAGYRQYEISNFARAGHKCRHNENTWRMAEWIGLGPSAASQYAGWRSSNVADLEQWRADVESGRRSLADSVELTPRTLAEDSLIFGLRMNEGVDLPELQTRFPETPWKQIGSLVERLLGEGLAVMPEGRLRLTLQGRLLADAVAGQVMDALE